MRRALFLAGIALLAIIWLGPLPSLAPFAFWAHMTMHMGVVAIAAPLIALGISGTRLDPVEKSPRLWAPIPAAILELIIVWAWHAPGAHHWARHSSVGLVVEQSMFLAAGLFVWISAFGGDPETRSRIGAGIIGLLLTAMHMTLLGALLSLTPRPLYDHAATFGSLTPLEDQHLGGAIMLLVGGVSYLAGGIWLTAKLLRSANAPTRSSSDVPPAVTRASGPEGGVPSA
ncbi:MAG: cytochrome c oxidase assembly protein [Thermoanaerobaculia bacterium]|nr:cytochrome c oxidase assembly protein [Thermoanaerobaculia bacterium]